MNGLKSQSRKQQPAHQLHLIKTDLDNIIADITSAAEKVRK